MIKKNILLLMAAMVAGCMSGCSCDQIGMSPPGMTSAEMREAFNKLPLDQRAKQLLDAPGPMGNKATQIRGWYAAAGIKIPDDLNRRLGGGGGGGTMTR